MSNEVRQTSDYRSAVRVIRAVWSLLCMFTVFADITVPIHGNIAVVPQICDINQPEPSCTVEAPQVQICCGR